MLNILTEIFNYIYRRLQNNSCNKITFKDIGFHFMLQKQFFHDTIKAQLMFNIFITYLRVILCWYLSSNYYIPLYSDQNPEAVCMSQHL